MKPSDAIGWTLIGVILLGLSFLIGKCSMSSEALFECKNYGATSFQGTKFDCSTKQK